MTADFEPVCFEFLHENASQTCSASCACILWLQPLALAFPLSQILALTILLLQLSALVFRPWQLLACHMQHVGCSVDEACCVGAVDGEGGEHPVGLCATPEDAARAHDAAALRLFGLAGQVQMNQPAAAYPDVSHAYPLESTPPPPKALFPNTPWDLMFKGAGCCRLRWRHKPTLFY